MKKRLFFYFLSFTLFLGCASTGALKKADIDQQKSQYFLNKAIQEYKEALNSPDAALARFKLAKLYYQNGEYPQAIEELKLLPDKEAEKLLAFCYYKNADYTDALSIFNQLGKISDDEYLYYYGLTCEKQNLFEQARDMYSQIKGSRYNQFAKERINIIEAQDKGILDDETKNLVKNSPTQEQFPQAAAVILLADEKVEILPNNTSVSSEHFVVKILNERGKNAYSEIVIGYDSTFEKVDLEFARTISPDGKVTYTGKRHIRDVSKYLNFPLYSNARALIISMPDISDGSIIEYKATISCSQLVNKKDFTAVYTLQDSDPLLSAKFSITIPSERILHQKIINQEYNKFGISFQPKIKKENTNTIYQWELRDIPQIIPEPAMPPDTKINTLMLLSTFNSWEEIYQWWWNLAKDKIEITPQIQAKVNELIKGKIALEEKARAIYNYVAEEIRYVAIEYGQAGYEPHKAGLIFANKYGDCKDKAILLISMFKAAGIKSYPVIIGTKETPDLLEDFPTLLFNHCIAAAEIQGKLIFLDPTAETIAFGDLPIMDQERKVLVYFPDKIKILTTPIFAAAHNRISYDTVMKINPDETVLGKRVVETFGSYDSAQRGWLKDTMPILREEIFKQKVKEIVPDGKLLNYHIDNLDDLNKSIKLEYQFQGKGFLSRAGKARILPSLGSGPDTSLLIKDKREYPIEFILTDQIDTVIRIELPDNLEVKYLPDPIIYHTPWLILKKQYFKEGKAIIFKETKILKKTKISQKEYPQFKKFSEALAQKMRQVIILEKK